MEQVMNSVEGTAKPKKVKKPINRQKLQDNLWGWAFTSPLIIGTVIFTYIALILTIILSFTGFKEGNLFEYLGNMGLPTDKRGNEMGLFYWYQYMFTDKIEVKNLYSGLFNAVFYMIGIPIGMILSMFFAVCMTRDIKGGNVYRIIYYLPSVASAIAISYTFQKLFDGKGMINRLFFGSNESAYVQWLRPTGVEGVAESWNPAYITQKWVVVIMSVWKGLGGTIILYVAGLSGVNASHKEAASIDGANGWITFWAIVIPQLWPTIFYNIVTAVIGGMQIYAEPDLIFNAKSGTGYSYTYSGYVGMIFSYGPQGGDNMNLAYAGALGIFLAIIIAILTLFQFYLDSKADK